MDTAGFWVVWASRGEQMQLKGSTGMSLSSIEATTTLRGIITSRCIIVIHVVSVL